MHRSLTRIFSFIGIILLLTGCDSNPTESHYSAAEGLFVLNGGAQTVSHIDLTTDKVTLQFANAREIPADIGILGEHLLVLNSTPASMDIYLAEDGSSVTTINLPGGSNPYGLHIDGNYIYVSGWNTGQLYIVNAGSYSLEDSVTVGIGPQGITSDESHIFVANTGGWPEYAGSSVSVISKSDYSVVNTIDVSTNPQDFTWASDGKLHAVCTGNYNDIFGKVGVINPVTMQVDTTLRFGGTPGFIESTSDGAVYLADAGDADRGYLYAYNGKDYTIYNDNESPISVNNGAMDMIFDEAEELLYIANYNANTVQSFDVQSNEVIQTYEVNEGPQALALW